MHGDVGEGRAQSWVLGSAERCTPPMVSCSYFFIQYRLIVMVSGDRVEVKGSSYCGTTPWYIGLAALYLRLACSIVVKCMDFPYTHQKLGLNKICAVCVAENTKALHADIF